MSRLGNAIAFGAEVGIWIAGAALIAGAAGMHWSVDLPSVDLDALTGAKSSAAASGSPGPSLIIKLPTPSASPAGPSSSVKPSAARPSASPARATPEPTPTSTPG
ncbi:MAG TPA: hypothetical protein VF371_00880 [Candidatus Limnocylindrales bacterium]